MVRDSLVQIETDDRRLLDRIDASLGESVRRSGEWVVCRAGCTQCCLGPFAITALDALRLRRGLEGLASKDEARAERLGARVADYTSLLASLGGTDPLAHEELENLPCPVLDPATGLCDLYDARPITCRTFGPVTRTADGNLAACELCYEGATDVEMAQCVVEVDPDGLEEKLLHALGEDGMTIVARALADF